MQQSTFADLGVSKAVASALRERGIERPFAVQELVVGDVLDGHDVLLESPTGSGKTLAFGIPLVDSVEPGRRAGRRPGEPGGLVLAPTRELASQIVDELDAIARARGLSIAAVYGGAGINPQIKAARRADVLVATPGRLVDLLDRGAVALGEVDVLVLDEADRMLDMGFRPVVDRLVALTPDDRQTLLFSATLAGEVDRIARAYTQDARRHAHRPPQEASGSVEHRFVKVSRERRTDQLVAELTEQERGRTLVFVRTKRGADRLAKQLGRVPTLTVAAMHGDKSQAQRERALAAFEAGRVDTLVATDVAARGIDVRDVTHVINFDAPAAVEDYVHRVGRTARAGADGVGITFVLDDQVRDVAAIGTRLGLQRELSAAGLGASEPAGARTSSQTGGRPRSRNRRRRSGRPRPAA
ncbi:MAG: DEAD/DEAH box helicase [Actinobacteria bacterium]|nr:DEAD/DEAH box helicase [Actinomycetota bacterium]